MIVSPRLSMKGAQSTGATEAEGLSGKRSPQTSPPDNASQFLNVLYNPFREPTPDKPTGQLGIGVITYNRLKWARGCIAGIECFTDVPYSLVVADDGSPDGTAERLRGAGYAVVTGRNHGVAWNKNRALWHLLEHTDCDPIIILEEDAWPVETDWAQVWIECVQMYQHVNYADTDKRFSRARVGDGTPANPYWPDWAGGMVTANTRAMLAGIGCMDTRFQGYGVAHQEWTNRACRVLRAPRQYPSLSHGVRQVSAGTFLDRNQLDRNRDLWNAVASGPAFRLPWRNDEQREEVLREQEAALCSVQ